MLEQVRQLLGRIKRMLPIYLGGYGKCSNQVDVWAHVHWRVERKVSLKLSKKVEPGVYMYASAYIDIGEHEEYDVRQLEAYAKKADLPNLDKFLKVID
jgi:hypothetical protein